MEPREINRLQANLLRHAMHRANLRVDEVWLHYFSFGGDAGQMEVEAYLNNALALPTLQRDMLAHAINELIDDKPVIRAPYAEELMQQNSTDAGDGEESVEQQR